MSEKKLLPGFRPGGFLGKLYPDGVPAPAPIAPAPVFKRGRLVFAFDATASRSGGWQTAVQLTDTLFTAVPDALDVALAEHGGARVRTFTDFVRNAGKLRKLAAGIECEGGFTRMLPILKSAAGIPGVGVVLYIGDAFEESGSEARRLAAALKANGTRLIVLFEGRDPYAESIYAEMAAVTGGAVLPFDLSSLGKLRELLAAVAVLAVGGVELLEHKKHELPGATLLLEHLRRGSSS